MQRIPINSQAQRKLCNHKLIEIHVSSGCTWAYTKYGKIQAWSDGQCFRKDTRELEAAVFWEIKTNQSYHKKKQELHKKKKKKKG